MNIDPKILEIYFKMLLESQQDLDELATNVLYGNLWDMYECCDEITNPEMVSGPVPDF